MLIGTALLIVIGAIVILWQSGGYGSSDESVEQAVGSAETEAGSLNEGVPARETSPEELEKSLVGGPLERDRERPGQEALFISGSVKDKPSGAPVNAFGLEVFFCAVPGKNPVMLFYREFHEADGRFFIPVDQGGTYHLCASASSHRDHLGMVIEVPDGKGQGDIVIELDPGLAVSGSVVDETTGAPVQGATVFEFSASLMDIAEGFPSRGCHTVTDEKGFFRLSGLDDEWKTICAIHHDYTPAHGEAAPGTDELLISLGRGHRIFGTVLDDSGEPCPGVIIAAMVLTGNTDDAYGFELPVLSGPDGSYSTPQIRPGEIKLEARSRRQGSRDRAKFTAEETKVEIIDRDVEVNFGPWPSSVTWRGALVDVEGLPPVTARIYCRAIEYFGDRPPGWNRSSRGSFFYSADDGSFERRKLLPGRYGVRVYFGPHFRRRIDCGEVSFPEPGVVEKEIRVPGGAVRGTVVDEGTGAAPAVRFLSVKAVARADEDRRHETAIDAGGEFILRGLPAGFYSVTVDLRLDGRKGRVDNLEVVEGELLDGIEIRVPSREAAGGFVKLTFVDFIDQEGAFTMLRFGDSERANKLVTAISLSSKEGTCSWLGSMPFDEGLWTVTVEVIGFGRVEKPFEIFKGGTTDVQLFRSEFTTTGTGVDVEGTIRWTGGEPAAQARIRVESEKLLGPEQGITLEAAAGDDGAFTLQGLIPGKWKVAVEPASGGRRCFPLLDVPREAVSPLRHDIVLPRGTVRGTLVDGLTGQPIDTGSSPWRALLLSPEKRYHDSYWWTSLEGREEWLVRLDGANSGPSLIMAGIPAGTYIVRVEAEGYFEYASDPITLAEGGDLDLGAIRLEAGGIVIVEALDELGAPLERFEVEFPDLYSTPACCRLPDGRLKYWRLPSGEQRLYIKAGGCKGAARKVELRPGAAEEVRVILPPVEAGSDK